ncbi:MAG: 4-hydroxy-3-methylbut-2-enyl diphosphate reductase [Nitrospinae bacterium]|nr:4-hydroxy-3-methylbut-2-enyl diphosphate reductase [Nitrospinota bacterium]
MWHNRKMSGKEEIKIARTAGFCWGVKRAMDIAMDTANNADGPVYTHGPLIHNPQVIETLEGKDIFALEDATTLDHGTVIIRTHGVTPQVRRRLKEKGLTINDATCPLVAKVQGIIKKHAAKGFSTIIIGDLGHAEVVGLLGFADGKGHVVARVEEVAGLPQMDSVCVVAQTTCDITKYKAIVEAIQARFPNADITNTICDATDERQNEVLRLAGEVDLLIVVGGKSSANTARLAAIARETGVGVSLVETETELDPAEILKYQRIGITAGASTPTWMIERVRDRVAGIREGRKGPARGLLARLAEAWVVSNLHLGAGAGLLTLANAMLAGYEPGWRPAAVAAMYIFSMHVLNQLNDLQTFKHNEPEKTRFYQRWGRLMGVLAGLSAVMGLALAAYLDASAALIYTMATFMGLAYTVKWFPKTRIIRIHRLKDIPASKDIFAGLGWAAVTVAMPAMSAPGDVSFPAAAVAFVFAFTMVYIRSVLSDIRDIRGDRVVGRETIPILIGITGSKTFLAMVTTGLACMLVSAAYSGLVGPFAYALLLSIGYTAMYLWLYHRRTIDRGLAFDLVVDGVFHFTGLLAITWLLIS